MKLDLYLFGSMGPTVITQYHVKGELMYDWYVQGFKFKVQLN